jgi:hypothetical protein
MRPRLLIQPLVPPLLVPQHRELLKDRGDGAIRIPPCQLGLILDCGRGAQGVDLLLDQEVCQVAIDLRQLVLQVHYFLR